MASGPKYEAAKNQYWRERDSRFKEFASKLDHQPSTSDYSAFSKSEKPHIAAMKEGLNMANDPKKMASAHGFPPGHPLHQKMTAAHDRAAASGLSADHPDRHLAAHDRAAASGLSADHPDRHLTDKMHSDHASPRDAKLESIAKQHLGLSTLKTQNSDERDFHEHASWQVHSALQAAYHAGRGTEGSTNPDHQAAAKRAGEAAAPHVPSKPTNSSSDFKEHSVWGMKEAMGHAYDMGARAKKVGFDREPVKGQNAAQASHDASDVSGRAGRVSRDARAASDRVPLGRGSHDEAADAHAAAAGAHQVARDAHLKAAKATDNEATSRMHVTQAQHHQAMAKDHANTQQEHAAATTQTGPKGGTYTVGPGGSKHYIK